MKIPISFITAIILLSALPVHAQQFPLHYVNAFKQAQDKRMAADKKLLDKMEDAADWLTQFRLTNGHFPEMGLEQDKSTSILQSKILLPNPYTVTGVASKEESSKPCPVRFITESGLNQARFQEYQKKAGADWRAEPGTITVLFDPRNAILIWGAGADRQPIFDSKSNQYMIAWREIAN